MMNFSFFSFLGKGVRACLYLDFLAFIYPSIELGRGSPTWMKLESQSGIMTTTTRHTTKMLLFFFCSYMMHWDLAGGFVSDRYWGEKAH